MAGVAAGLGVGWRVQQSQWWARRPVPARGPRRSAANVPVTACARSHGSAPNGSEQGAAGASTPPPMPLRRQHVARRCRRLAVEQDTAGVAAGRCGAGPPRGPATPPPADRHHGRRLCAAADASVAASRTPPTVDCHRLWRRRRTSPAGAADACGCDAGRCRWYRCRRWPPAERLAALVPPAGGHDAGRRRRVCRRRRASSKTPPVLMPPPATAQARPAIVPPMAPREEPRQPSAVGVAAASRRRPRETAGTGWAGARPARRREAQRRRRKSRWRSTRSLGTILYSPDRKLAIVNGRIVGPGDEVNGAHGSSTSHRRR